jgi:ArsR family transcriptional regulator
MRGRSPIAKGERTVAKQSVDKSLKDAARILKATGHPARLAVLECLIEGAKTVGDIQNFLSVSQPNLSQHLAILKRVGLIQAYSSSTLRCYYLLRPTLVEDLFALIRKDHKPADVPKERVLGQAIEGAPARRASKAAPKPRKAGAAKSTRAKKK